MSSKPSRRKRIKRRYGRDAKRYSWGWRKGHDLGLRLAILAAAKRQGKSHLRESEYTSYVRGKKWLAEGLGIKVQSIDHWQSIPKDRLMMVHMLTRVPLAKLNPKLFGKQ